MEDEKQHDSRGISNSNRGPDMSPCEKKCILLFATFEGYGCCGKNFRFPSVGNCFLSKAEAAAQCTCAYRAYCATEDFRLKGLGQTRGAAQQQHYREPFV